MFTGIVEAVGSVESFEGGLLTISRPEHFDDLKIGSSISIAGVCATIMNMNKNSMQFQIIDETLQKSKIGSFMKGDSVNLERAIMVGSRLDGHCVQGHIQAVATVVGVCPMGEGMNLSVQLPEHLVAFAVPQGSIALDGVSLTIAHVKGNVCVVALIPYTLQHTSFGILKIGDVVNVEMDIALRSNAQHYHPVTFASI